MILCTCEDETHWPLPSTITSTSGYCTDCKLDTLKSILDNTNMIGQMCLNPTCFRAISIQNNYCPEKIVLACFDFNENMMLVHFELVDDYKADPVAKQLMRRDLLEMNDDLFGLFR